MSKVCIYCNELIPDAIEAVVVDSGKVASHHVDLFAHPSCAYHGKSAFEPPKRTFALDQLISKIREIAETGDAESMYDEPMLLAVAETLESRRPIPVSERLPESSGFYLVYAARKNWMGPVWQLGSYALRNSDGAMVWVRDDAPEEMGVTHWLPLPPAP